jgi:hypothetical protein
LQQEQRFRREAARMEMLLCRYTDRYQRLQALSDSVVLMHRRQTSSLANGPSGTPLRLLLKAPGLHQPILKSRPTLLQPHLTSVFMSTNVAHLLRVSKLPSPDIDTLSSSRPYLNCSASSRDHVKVHASLKVHDHMCLSYQIMGDRVIGAPALTLIADRSV